MVVGRHPGWRTGWFDEVVTPTLAAMLRTGPPFRADHVGSLLRPPALLHARAEHAAGRVDARALRAAEDADAAHLRYVARINAAPAGRWEGMRVTTHLCRGDYRSSWAAEGGYDVVAEALFGGPAVDGFFCEFDDERSGGFEPLRS